MLCNIICMYLTSPRPYLTLQTTLQSPINSTNLAIMFEFSNRRAASPSFVLRGMCPATIWSQTLIHPTHTSPRRLVLALKCSGDTSMRWPVIHCHRHLIWIMKHPLSEAVAATDSLIMTPTQEIAFFGSELYGTHHTNSFFYLCCP